MRVGVIQSNYIPWRGYFDFIQSVDLFVFHDDLQYTKGDWRNRNKIKTHKGLEWLSVPVHYNNVKQKICDTEIVNNSGWYKKHESKIKAAYSKSPFLTDVLNIFKVADCDHKTISHLNIELIKAVCNYYEIKTEFILSSELSLSGSKTERLIELIKKVGATKYLSGPNAEAYLEKQLFYEEGIILEYKSYDYPVYPQSWGEFIGQVSIIDLIANCGKDGKGFLNSLSENKVIIN
jgi:hypothetical protein